MSADSTQAAKDLQDAVRRRNQSKGTDDGLSQVIAEANKEVPPPEAAPTLSTAEARDIAMAAQSSAVAGAPGTPLPTEVGDLLTAQARKVKRITEQALPLDPIRLMVEEAVQVDIPFMKGSSVRFRTLPSEVELDVAAAVQQMLEDRVEPAMMARLRSQPNPMDADFYSTTRRVVMQAAYLGATLMGHYPGPPDQAASCTPVVRSGVPGPLDIYSARTQEERVQKIKDATAAWLNRSAESLMEWSLYYNAVITMVRKALADDDFIENGLKD